MDYDYGYGFNSTILYFMSEILSNKFEKNSMECTKPLKDTSYQNLLSMKFTTNSVISNKENLNPWWFHW